jgi:hypothetical protein
MRERRWATKFGSSGVDAVNAITFGPTGKAYVTGEWSRGGSTNMAVLL